MCFFDGQDNSRSDYIVKASGGSLAIELKSTKGMNERIFGARTCASKDLEVSF
jgi:hypothetical protein